MRHQMKTSICDQIDIKVFYKLCYIDKKRGDEEIEDKINKTTRTPGSTTHYKCNQISGRQNQKPRQRHTT